MRVASLFLPRLAVERLRRRAPSAPPPERRPVQLPIDDDPGACSVPRGGHWRPGARWATERKSDRDRIDEDASSLPAHQRPTMRALGRRSEAARHPFRADDRGDGDGVDAWQPTAAPSVHALQPPLVVAARIGRRDVVVAACPGAEAAGIIIGTAVTFARVLVPGLQVADADPGAEAAILDRLSLHAIRHWTPIAAPSGRDGVWLDLTGVAHLHGGERRFASHVVELCRRAGFTARMAVADTPGCAHAVARYGPRAIEIVASGWTTETLEPLPVAALRLDAAALTAARRFGFRHVEDLMRLPRAPLARRLGLGTVTRLDQARGMIAEPIVPVVDEQPPTVERRLMEPIGERDQVERVVKDLTADLVDLLRERGRGARSIRLTARRVDGIDQTVAIGTARATREAAHLVRLLGLRLDRLDPGLGFEAFTLVAERSEPLAATGLGSVLVDDPAVGDVAGLVDVLVGRIGPRRLFRMRPVESHVPERAVTRGGPLEMMGDWPAWSRPVRLFQRPEPLSAVMALLPDQPPRRFSWRGRDYRVSAADGPERIHGEWWVRDAETYAVRDYFRVEDQDGGRWWIFRRGDGEDAMTGDHSWWMHGAG